MTEMRAEEVRLNLILAIATLALGAVLAVLGEAGIKKHLFLPEYAQTTKGVGITLLIAGLLWLGLSRIKHAALPSGKAAR